jgi:hypothetical protein
MENHFISNDAESNWASVASLVPVVESRDLIPINSPLRVDPTTEGILEHSRSVACATSQFGFGS